jgi:Sec-independent protein translocase protein TatA
MGFAAETLVMLGLGFVLLGPKQLNSLLQRAVRAKAEWDKASSGLKSQLMAEVGDAESQARRNE